MTPATARPLLPRRAFGLFLAGALGLAACQANETGTSRAYVVFFTHDSAVLDAPARQVIADAAAAARAAPGAAVTVVGWTDSFGSAAADVVLSRQRADRVAAALTAAGVAPGRLQRQGRGQTREDPGVASRRVEIEIGS